MVGSPSWSIRIEDGRVLVQFRDLLLPVSLSPIDAAMMSVELAEASAAAGAGKKAYATREQRIATIEAARARKICPGCGWWLGDHKPGCSAVKP